MNRTTLNLTSTVALLVFLGSVSSGAENKPSVPYPEGFRSWQHVKSIIIGPEHQSFAIRGGIHHYYANDKALKGYRTGKFPNGSVIVDEAVFTRDGEGQGKGILLEGERRGIDVMVKDDRRYRETGGWGFEHFEKDSRASALAEDARARCYACHSKRKEQDHVFSAIRK